MGMWMWISGIPVTVALAIVATVGYWFGQRTRVPTLAVQNQSRHESKKAKAVIGALEDIAQEVRRSLAIHHANILNFKQRVADLSQTQGEVVGKKICSEAERMLKPTTLLATQLANAYEELRQQTSVLTAITQVRTDPLTGLNNRRALEEQLDILLAMTTRYGRKFSVAIFDIDHFKQLNEKLGHTRGDQVLQEVAQLFDECVRETDTVVRYGGEEFVIIMPETGIEEVAAFAERVRLRIAEEMAVTVSAGVVTAHDGDVPRTLIARADSALYSAKAGGRNRVFRHTGTTSEPVAPLPPSPSQSRSQDGPKSETTAETSLV